MIYTYYLFWICIIFAIYKRFYDYSISFFILFLTSYLIHTRDDYNNYLYYIDRIAICLVVYIGFIYYTRSSCRYIPIICVLMIIIIYYTDFIVFSNPKYKYEIVHILTVIGHVCVMMFQT